MADPPLTHSPPTGHASSCHGLVHGTAEARKPPQWSIRCRRAVGPSPKVLSKTNRALPGQWLACIKVTCTPPVFGTSEVTSKSRSTIHLGSTLSCCRTRLPVARLQYMGPWNYWVKAIKVIYLGSITGKFSEKVLAGLLSFSAHQRGAVLYQFPCKAPIHTLDEYG